MKLYLQFVAMCFLLLCSCADSSLENALALAGGNRAELERVLEHYAHDPADSLKLRAAEFLIENMPWHYSYGGKYYQDYVRKVDSMHRDLPLELRMVLYTLPEKHPALASQLEIEPDIEHITADYLIHNIEHSFDTWEKSYWLRDLNFENFCEYLLPYRLSREPLLYWKDSLRSEFAYTIKNATGHLQDMNQDTYMLYRFLNTHLMGNAPNYVEIEIETPDPVIGKYKFDCITGSIAYTYLWRMCGIPTAVDELPRWANGNNYHADIAIIHERSATGIVPKDIHFLTAKAYRNTFSVNRSQILHASRDYIPPTPSKPFYKDVTPQYIRTMDVTIRPPTNGYKPEYLYLGVFNLGWEAITHAKIKGGEATFDDVGVGCVYIPFYYKENRQIFCANPFYIDVNRQIHYFNPDPEQLRTITLDRKIKIAEYKVWWGKLFRHARFEASDVPGFNRTNHVASIDDNYYWRIRTVPVNVSPSRYYRLINNGWPAELGEIHFFDQNGDEIKGSLIGDPITMANPDLPNIQDNDLLTFAAFESWVGVDFGRPTALSRIEYVPRNDKNGIYPGMRYELLYFDTDRWSSMGVRTATDYTITFEGVPEGALLWLRNLTEGREERIFTYENGRQMWW